MIGLLDSFLSEHQWYRKRRGGTWHQIRVLLLQGCFIGWVRGETVYDNENVLETEVWSDRQ